MKNQLDSIFINNNTSIMLNFNIKEYINNVLNLFKFKNIFFEISFINDIEIKKIHKEYFNLDYTTDIITFNLNTKSEPHADIYICVDEAKRNAELLNHNIEYEIKTLIVHGVLHLVGYDDLTKTEKETMFKEQNRILKLLEVQPNE